MILDRKILGRVLGKSLESLSKIPGGDPASHHWEFVGMPRDSLGFGRNSVGFCRIRIRERAL